MVDIIYEDETTIIERDFVSLGLTGLQDVYYLKRRGNKSPNFTKVRLSKLPITLRGLFPKYIHGNKIIIVQKVVLDESIYPALKEIESRR